MRTVSKVFRFEHVELDLGRFELRRAERRLPLSRLPMELLILLVEQRGRLVTREEIVARLWPNPDSIDSVQGINVAINRVRAVLNDNATKPRFIETVVGKGYRFICDVEEIEAAPPFLPNQEQQKAEREEKPERIELASAIYPPKEPEDLRDRPRLPAWALWATVCLLLVGSFSAMYWKTHPRTAAKSKLAENQPDGPVLRQTTTLVPENRATAAAISPDGRLTAFANVDGIFLRTEVGDISALPSPPGFVIDRLAWFADETRLVASGFSGVTNIPSVWNISVTGLPARKLRGDARHGIPSPDGSRIVFTHDESEIWSMGSSGEEARCILTGHSEDSFPFIIWSPDSKRVVFQRRTSLHRERPDVSYESIELATAKLTVLGKQFTRESELRMSSAAALPDGRVMFLRWDNENSNSSHELWEIKTDGKTNTFVGEPARVAVLGKEELVTFLGLSVSNDARRALVLKQSGQDSIFVANFNASSARLTNARRLTLDERASYPHAWTADSRSVIFESNRNGNFDLFRQNTARRISETIISTPLKEILPQLSPDGRFVLYAARPPEDQHLWYQARTYRLMRVPVEGGTPDEVNIGGLLDEFRCPLYAGKSCVLRTTVDGEYRAYYELDPIAGKGHELARVKWSPETLGDWDVSPDGTRVAIPNHDAKDARIRVVNLNSRLHTLPVQDISLPGMSNLTGLVWAADNRSWFISTDTTVGSRLFYAHDDGSFQFLGDIQGWAVPSPDGRKVAFLNRSIATNAWTMKLPQKP